MEITKAYQELDLPLIKYITHFAIPITIVGFVIQYVLLDLFPFVFPAIRFLIYSIPIYCITVVVIFPMAKFQNRKIEIGVCYLNFCL